MSPRPIRCRSAVTLRLVPLGIALAAAAILEAVFGIVGDLGAQQLRCGGLEGQVCLFDDICSGPGPECVCIGAIIPSDDELRAGAQIIPGRCRALIPLDPEPDEPEEIGPPDEPEDPAGPELPSDDLEPEPTP